MTGSQTRSRRPRAACPAGCRISPGKGDFRYRNETIEQDYVKDRNRDRIRVRAGFVAKVNDTIKTEVRISTAGEWGSAIAQPDADRRRTCASPRTLIWRTRNGSRWLTGNSRAARLLYPWVRPGQSLFFDGDINPEGLACELHAWDFFGSAFYNILEERAAAGETTMAGGQLRLAADDWQRSIDAWSQLLCVQQREGPQCILCSAQRIQRQHDHDGGRQLPRR